MSPDVQPAVEPEPHEARRSFVASLESRLDRRLDVVALFIITIGFVLRVIPAARFYLNPDEASNLMSAFKPTLRAVLADVAITPHPPLYFLLLHYWRLLGSSDFMVRLPSVLASTGMLWFFYRWLSTVFSRTTGLIGLTLMALAPEMIAVSAEVRQYPLVMLFMAMALYYFELGLREGSARKMILVAAAQLLMVSTHYSAFAFLAITGLYGLFRIILDRPPVRTAAAWLGGEVVTAGLALTYYVLHLSKLRGGGMEASARDDWLRLSYFHPEDERLPWFVLRQFVAVFRYVFSHPVAGLLGAILFTGGIVLLFVRKGGERNRGQLTPFPQRKTGSCPHFFPGSASGRRSRPWLLGLLLLLAFVIGSGMAVIGVYPFGGTRHNVYLALFAIPAVSYCLAFLARQKIWPILLATIIVVPLWHLRMVPPRQYIVPRNQERRLVLDMMDYVRQVVPPVADSERLNPAQRRTAGLIFTDLQTQNLLRRYLAHSRTAQQNGLPDTLTELAYPDYRIAVSRYWGVSADTLGTEFAHMARAYGLEDGDTVCVAAGGWGYNLADQLKTKLKMTYPGLKKFGDNLAVFRMAVGTEPTARNLARRSERAAQELEQMALALARQRPTGIRSVFWPTDLLTDSTDFFTNALTDHTVSYYELYAALRGDASRFGMYLPALAFWETSSREHHPPPMSFMKDLENYVSDDYRFTLLAVTADSLAAVYEITSDANGEP